MLSKGGYYPEDLYYYSYSDSIQFTDFTICFIISWLNLISSGTGFLNIFVLSSTSHEEFKLFNHCLS